jgi:hypothetical protein
MLISTERRGIYNRFVALLMVCFTLSFPVAAQTVRQKLARPADYRPRATNPDEQLIEVARHFKIPMAIEWLDETPAGAKPPELKFEKGTVLDLIKAIVARAPHQKLTIEDRLVRIFPPSVLKHRLNFLNFRVTRYCVKNESVLGADFWVRVGIDTLLYPKAFRNGFNGGYGGGEQVLWIENINICVKDSSIRRLLTEIAAQSGNAGWMAHVKRKELRARKPFWKGVPLNEYGTSAITGHWFFFELVEHGQ